MVRTVAFGRTLAVSTINGVRFTPNEGQFLKMVGNGLTILEIARAMGILETTARVYQCNLRHKAGLKNRPGFNPHAFAELYQWLPPSMKRAKSAC